MNRIMPDRDKQTHQLRVNLHGDYQVNYGMLPQTFSDPKVLASGTKFRGDGDPIDALELGILCIISHYRSIVHFLSFGFWFAGSRQMPTGTVAAVKIVGALALIDNDAMDWKILVIRLDDPLAELIHDVADVERFVSSNLAPYDSTNISFFVSNFISPDISPAPFRRCARIFKSTSALPPVV